MHSAPGRMSWTRGKLPGNGPKGRVNVQGEIFNTRNYGLSQQYSEAPNFGRKVKS